jgi:hypothetical protein
VEVDAGDVSGERARKKSNGIREFVQLSDATKRNVSEQRQDATLDIVPRRSSWRDPPCFPCGAKPLFEPRALNRPGEIVMTVTPSAATAFAIEAVIALIAAFAAA